jgi:shikimate 5-dehydrogenase
MFEQKNAKHLVRCLMTAAILGFGESGQAAACYLKKLGVPLVVYERPDKVDALRAAHPEQISTSFGALSSVFRISMQMAKNVYSHPRSVDSAGFPIMIPYFRAKIQR